MKNVKTIICFAICLLAGLSILLLSPFTLNVNAGVVDKGTSYVRNSQTRFLTIGSNKTSLYDEHVENLYTVSSCNNGTGSGNDGTVSFDKSNNTIKYSALSNVIDKKNPRIETAFRLNKKYEMAVQKGLITISLKVKISNKNCTTQIGVQDGTISTSGVDGFSSWTAKDGNYNVIKEASSLEKEGDYYILNFVPNSTDILLVFAGTKSGGGINTIELSVSNPEIELSANSNPTINFNNVLINGKNTDASWTKDSKKLTFNVEDNNFGVDYVTINGERINCDEATKNNYKLKSYTYFVDSVAETNYNIIAYDCLGGTVNISRKIGFVDKVDVSDIIINAEKSYHEKNISIDISFVEDVLHSHDSVYYTLIDNSTGDDPTPNPDDLSGRTKQVPHQNGKYTFNFPFEYDGEYTLTILICDEAGHSKIQSKTFIIDSVKRRVNIISHNGNYEVTGVYTDENGFYTWNGENITLKYNANENFSFYKLLRNGSEMQTNGSVYNYTCKDADINIEIFNRFVVNVNAVTTYEFNENGIDLSFELNSNLLIDVLTKQELSSLLKEDLDNLTNEEILEKLNNLITSDLNFIIKQNGFVVDNIYNKGDYSVSYSIDNTNFIGASTFNIVVNPKALQVEYLENSFTYTGKIQNVNYKQITGQTINVKYYLVNENGDIISEEVEFKNAGNYKVVLNLDDNNYCLTNGEILLSINKKQIEVNVENTVFKFNNTNQNIVYSLQEKVDSIVKYFVNVNNQNIQTDFLNAGEYTYYILPVDEINYEFLNNSGDCQILKINANIQVNKYVYDYTGNVVSLSYSVTDENNQEIQIDDIVISYFVNNTEANFVEPNTYTFVFDVLNKDNYNLSGTLTGNVTIKKTIINVFVNSISYEYTGNEIGLDYYFLNEDNEKLTSLNNISLQFLQEGRVVPFLECGEYSYNFVTTDVNYEIIYNNKTNIEIIPAVLNVQVLESEYIYNSLGNTLNYVILSKNNVNYTNNNFISLKLTSNGNDATLLNVGTYEYSFISSNSNIVLSTGNISGTVIVNPKQVILQEVITEYTYTGEELIFSYTLSEDIPVSFEIDTLLNVGSYEFVITSSDCNYEVINNIGTVVVNPKQIEVLNIKTDYVYTGKNINVDFTLCEEVDTVITFSIINGDNSEIIDNIVNAGEYKVFITPTNSNYAVNSFDIIITINPKAVEVNVANTNQTYDKTDKQIDVIVEDNLEYSVTYYNENGEVVTSTKNAGNYNFVVSLNNSNYIGSATGTLVVEKATANLVVTPDQYKVYGDSLQETYEYSLQGLMSGDNIDIVLGREEGEDVGFYKINLLQFNNSNYNIEYNEVNFKIIAKKLIIVANNISKSYESLDPLLTYKITYGELVGEDILLGNLIREEGEDVGIYNINIGSLQTMNPNYQIVFKKANFNIIPSDLNIKINNIETVYGTEVQLSYSAERTFNEEMVTGNIVRENGFNVGEYVISRGTLESKNYNLIITNGVYKIKPKSATVTPLNLTKVYGEEDELTYSVVGLINNDSLVGNIGRENGENVGVYQVNLGSLQILNANYLFTMQDSLFTITKALITININNQTQVYGEAEKELTFEINGLKLTDKIDVKVFRESGDDVGVYDIACGIPQLDNYYVLLNSGKYTITKAKINPVLFATTTTYNGKEQVFQNTNFPYPLEYVYKHNGIQVNSVKNAGTYIVQGFFAGNNNYEEAKSNAVTFTINKVSVCFNLDNNNFIYDGEIKSPSFTFDSSLGLSANAITFEFENNAIPREIGSYPFTISVNDNNYTGFASGVLVITKPVTIVSDDAIIECEDADFDISISNLKLVSLAFKGNFNNQQVLQACSFENISGIGNGHIFTIKMKARTQDSNVYVYKVDKNNVATEVVVSVQDGYYVFKVDGLDCQYIITKDIEPMSLITIAVIIVVSIIVLVAIVVAFKVRRKRKKKLALQMANATTVQNGVVEENLSNTKTSKKHKNKKLRIDNVVSGAINNGTINTEVESIFDASKLNNTDNASNTQNNTNSENK